MAFRRIRWGIVALLLMGSPALAADPVNGSLMCEPPAEFLSPTEHLRALSLDLRGELPTMTEIQTVIAQGAVPDALIQSMMQTPEFGQQVVRFHHSLLWPYVGNARFDGEKREEDWPERLHYRGGYWPRFLRGGNVNVPCRDEPEADPNNIQPVDMGNGTSREGWVCVTPYWAVVGDQSAGDCPAGQIKVCAFDAQSAAISPEGTVCAEAKSMDRGCGCGPNLQRCSGYQEFNWPMLQSVDQQILWMLNNNRPYHEMLSHAPPYVNGPLAHFYKYIARDTPFPPEVMPDIDFSDQNTWLPVTVGAHYSGILTHPVYLRRFQTNRGRVDRFYNSFLCQPFQPPVGGLPPPVPNQAIEPDLQLRAGCKYCHSVIEPVGAYWGHWAEYSSSYLDPQTYPDFDPACLQCALLGNCDTRCLRNYVTRLSSPKEVPYQGWLNAFLYRADDDLDNIAIGPRLLVQRTVQDGRLPSCAVRNTVAWLMGRQVLPDEEAWLNDIVSVFAASNYDFRVLVHAVVTSEFYRRVR